MSSATSQQLLIKLTALNLDDRDMRELKRFRNGFRNDRRGAVAVLFATMAIPLAMITGLAVDYSMYTEVQAQLATAADAAAMHAVRIASANYAYGSTLSDATTNGNYAAKQWWDAQSAGVLTTYGVIPHVDNVQFDADTQSFSDAVTYSGNVKTLMVGAITRDHFHITGHAAATISSLSFVEVEMLVDNSSSMLIGASPADVEKLENLTICPPTATAVAALQGIGAYTWNYNSNYGYQNGNTIPAANVVNGSCDANFTGDPAQCTAPNKFPIAISGSPAFPAVIDSAGFCVAGTGIPDGSKRIDPGTKLIGNIPQAPCGFACHTGDGINDYYTLARKYSTANPSNAITLRFDVIQSAMANVIDTMVQKQQVPNQFTIGVFQFNNSVSQVHPASGEADGNLAGAKSDIKNIQPAIVLDAPNTNFPAAVSYLANPASPFFKPAGDGSSVNKPKKNIFIITDGLGDYGNRYIGPITNASPETNCALLKNLGFNVYVLYTPYYPLPNQFYLYNGPRGAVEPTVPPATTNPIVAGLQACASVPTQYYQASDSATINAAMQSMVQSAIASGGQITD